MKTLTQTALDWHDAGRSVAIATVVKTWGSAPRGVGSQLVIADDGAIEGSVSGGCVEGAVIVEALDAMADGTPRVLEYGVSDDEAFAVGLACGGQIRILVEPVGNAVPVDLLRDLLASKQASRPVAYVTSLRSGQPRLAEAEDYPARFRLDQSGVEEDGETFVAVHNPPLRLVIVGAVHITQHLLPMARDCGFAPIVIDPRPAFATPERFPKTDLRDDWPDEVLVQIGLDPRTAIVTLTHDPKIDDPAIETALGSDVFYIGCLGSKRTHAKRLERLVGKGFSAQDAARLHAPVGLDIGGRTPPEIAVSIIAEIIQALRTPS